VLGLPRRRLVFRFFFLPGWSAFETVRPPPGIVPEFVAQPASELVLFTDFHIHQYDPCLPQ